MENNLVEKKDIKLAISNSSLIMPTLYAGISEGSNTPQSSPTRYSSSRLIPHHAAHSKSGDLN